MRRSSPRGHPCKEHRIEDTPLVNFIRAVNLESMRHRERHEREHVAFGGVHQLGQLGEFRPQLIGDLAPLGAGCFGAFLGKHRVDQRQHELKGMLR
jgi:hypothetical protein